MKCAMGYMVSAAYVLRSFTFSTVNKYITLASFSSRQKQELITQVQETLFNLAALTVSHKGSTDTTEVRLTSKEVNVTAQQMPPTQAAGSTVQPDESTSLSLPESLADIATDGYLRLMVGHCHFGNWLLYQRQI